MEKTSLGSAKMEQKYHKWDSHLKKFHVAPLTSYDAFIELKIWLDVFTMNRKQMEDYKQIAALGTSPDI